MSKRNRLIGSIGIVTVGISSYLVASVTHYGFFPHEESLEFRLSPEIPDIDCYWMEKGERFQCTDENGEAVTVLFHGLKMSHPDEKIHRSPLRRRETKLLALYES